MHISTISIVCRGILRAAERACLQLPGGDYASFHTVRHCAWVAGSALSQHAVADLLRHAQGNGHAKRGHDAIDAERLVAHLPRLYHLPDCRGGQVLRPGKGRVVSGHIAALAVRGAHLIPAVVGLGDEYDLLALGIRPAGA